MHGNSTVTCRPVSEMATKETIPFSTKARGYDQDQVNQYINKLMGEYSNLRQCYTDLSDKYDELSRQSGTNMEVIAKVLVDAETNASKIMAEATAEAEATALKIVAEAKAEASLIVKKAHQELALIKNEKTQLLANVNDTVNRLKTFGLTESAPARKYISISVDRQ